MNESVHSASGSPVEEALQRVLNEIDALKAGFDAVESLTPEQEQSLQEHLSARAAMDSDAMDLEQLTVQGRSLLREKQVMEQQATEGEAPRHVVVERTFSGMRVENYERAVEFLYASLEAERPLTEELIKELHATLFEGITFARNVDGQWEPMDPAGVYKTPENHVATRDPDFERWFARPEEVPAEMAEFLRWYDSARDSMHPVRLAAQFAADFMAIHPFIDGNGRTARMCMNFILIGAGYPPAILRMSHRKRYLDTLRERSESGDVLPFATLVAEEVRNALRDIVALVEG